MARPGEFAASGRDEAESALDAALEQVDRTPTCTECSSDADFFLFEPRRVSKFVCWQHVSPISAVVDDEGSAVDRPLALPLSEEFE